MRELRTVLLGSASPRRRELLASLGLRVLVMPTGAEEPKHAGMSPRELSAEHAHEKMRAAARRLTAGVLVTADTVVDVDGRAYGKPRGPAEAVEFLRVLSDRTHLVHTSFIVLDGATERSVRETSTTRVRFVPLSEETIEAYVASGEALDKAGAYGIQGRGAALVGSIEGDFYTVMGFPLGAFVRSLPTLGLRLGHDAEAVAAQRGTAPS